MMQKLGDVRDHMMLLRRMAQATGVELTEAGLDQEMWASMVTRCRSCEWTDGCRRWLDDEAAALRDPPEGCVNKKILEELA